MASAWAIEASCSSSSSPIRRQFKYDVFMSFNGVDAHNNFTSHLLAALKRHGFHTFRDDTKLDRGQYISYELLKAIEKSRISLIVFSKNYAASRWCLDELMKIVECRKTLQHVVLPIFYDVEPSDVRAQKGSLAKAFAKHEEHFNKNSDGKVEKWRKALTEVANLSGWDLSKVANGDGSKLIQKIMEVVGNKLDLERLHVADHQVGLEPRLQELNLLLNMESDDVRIVAIWGIGGIGKTTIAKKLYNRVQHKFEGSSFLANVRETLKQPNGLVFLQEQLQSDILRNATLNARNFHQGIEVIKRSRKFLLVLDDVDDVKQLEKLVIDRDSFGSGSRIIITTRDKSSLKLLKVDEIQAPEELTTEKSSLNSLKVDEIYALEELNRDESIELFSWHAFKEDHPPDNRLVLSSEVVGYARGLPLVLEVLGSFLSGKSIAEWKSAIAKLKKLPGDDIQGILKVSFDSLRAEVKELFLDMACFFAGTDRNFIIKILGGCNSFSVTGIRELEDLCLIKYESINEKLVMHDLLRDMGRYIVMKESPEEPGMRSRLWHHEDILEVLRDGTGTEVVKGILLNVPEPSNVPMTAKALEKMNKLWYHENVLEDWRDGTGTEAVEGLFPDFSEPEYVQVNEIAFKKMNALWLLHLNYVHLTAGYEYISKRLSWLSWNGFPMEFMPMNLSMENLVALDLRYSSLKQVWKENKVLVNLRFLYLSHCYYLTRTPDFSGLNNLEELWFNGCIRLVEVDESIRYLHKLVVLDMTNCKQLQKLPSGMGMLKSLEFLDLTGCSNLGKLSGFKGSLSNLFSFLCSWMQQGERVDSIGLSLSTLQGLSCLTELRMRDCNISHLPNEIGGLVSLETLVLERNNLVTLPDSICNLTCLKSLNLEECDLSHLPCEIGRLISLESLRLGGNSLLTLPDSICDLTHLETLFLGDCNLSSLPSEIGRLVSLRSLWLAGSKFSTLPDCISNLTGLEQLVLRDSEASITS